jgi:hypothetical protein
MPSLLSRKSRDEATPSPLLDKFGLVLILATATILAQGLLDVSGSFFAASVIQGISGAALMVAVRASGVPRRWRRAADLLVAFLLLSNLVLAAVNQMDAGALTTDRIPSPGFLWVIAAVLVPVAIARRVLQHPVVTLQTIAGTVAAYLQLAVSYAVVFQALDAAVGAEIFGKEVPTTAYTYLSLTTISTLGYGDIVSEYAAVRMLAVSEAVIGQVFLVTFVAIIVSRFGSELGKGRTAEADSSESDG